jgi:hypothetical protein
MPPWSTTRPPGSRTKSVCTCQGLRPRRVVGELAIARPFVWPSAYRTASAPGISTFSRLNGWPAHSPVNASRTASRPPAHDSGPMWIRYSFIVMDSHHLLFAGLPALPIPAVRGTAIEPLESTLLGHSASHSERLFLLRVFGRLPVTDSATRSRAGVRKASGEETAGGVCAGGGVGLWGFSADVGPDPPVWNRGDG